jgi:selenide,water dikinase
MIESTTKLNTPGIALGAMDGVHALTDVTGFGLAGHLLEIYRASSAGAVVEATRLPLLPGVEALARAGHVTGATARNWTGYGSDVSLEAHDANLLRALVTDPQTSGGLLVACAPQSVAAVLEVFRREGFAHAAEIGGIVAGEPRVVVR